MGWSWASLKFHEEWHLDLGLQNGAEPELLEKRFMGGTLPGEGEERMGKNRVGLAEVPSVGGAHCIQQCTREALVHPQVTLRSQRLAQPVAQAVRKWTGTS